MLTNQQAGLSLSSAKFISPFSIIDTQPPLIFCPVDITVNAVAWESSAVVSWERPFATDNSRFLYPLVTNYEQGSRFPVGETKVTYTASDKSNNTASCSFIVTVIGKFKLNINKVPKPTLQLTQSGNPK